MGLNLMAECKNCGESFMVSEGGGFCFHLLHCSKCGKKKEIAFETLGDIHYRHIKGLKKQSCNLTFDVDELIQEETLGESLDEEEYTKAVEKYAGKCRCGGDYLLDATSRCPNCKSTQYKETGIHSYYD